MLLYMLLRTHAIEVRSGNTGLAIRVPRRYVYIPIEDMCDPEEKVRVDTSSRIYNRMIGHTGQPAFSKK